MMASRNPASTRCRRATRFAAFGLSMLLGLAAACVVAGNTSTDADARTWWMETRLADTPAGFLREQMQGPDADGWRTEIESALVLNRMDSRVEMRSLVRYVEAADGTLRSVSAEVGSSVEATVLDATVVDGVLRLRSTAGGRSYEHDTRLAQPLLGPQGIRERSRDTLRKPGDRFAYATFAGEFSSIANGVREVTGSETLVLDGMPTPTLIVREILDVMPVPTLLWLDADGRARRMQQESPFGTVLGVATDAGVQTRIAGGAELPEDTYRNAVARSNIRLPQARSIEQVRVRIDLERGDSVMPALDGPSQTLIERGERHAVIEVRRGAAPGSSADAPDGEPGDVAAWLAPNAYLQSDHPDVLAIATSLRRDGIGDYAQARVLQDWVTQNMAFDAGIALVTASEAVRDRRGTCMAYAVVLTTLARALEIPSRVVMGYIYAANMWGGHAWTEVLIDGRWVALDSAVWRAGPADAARIGVLRTSLEQGTASGIAALSQLYGNERVTVLDFTLDGRRIAVPNDAVSYRVDGRDYRNPWLGIGFRAPDEYTFADVDIMYPRSEIAVLRNAAGHEISVEQRPEGLGDFASPVAYLRARGFDRAGSTATTRVAGREAWSAEHDGKIAVAWRDGSDVWFVEQRGGDGAALAQLLDGFTQQPVAD